jgi:autotransporter translocation and assembly factor TamB
MQAAGIGQPMSFQVTLTNPIPVGEIRSKGQFGPWNVVEPSLTPVSGTYSFSNADLGTIRGLGGKLSSRGLYQGVLNQIQVQGETDTPDFDLGVSGNKVHLTTQFNAVVDGVTGDTLLQPVTAQLLGSKIVARGKVARLPGGRGREILLDVRAQPARLEDLLRLAVKSRTPSMTGAVSLHTNFDLQPGHETIMQRLKLDGAFDVQSARFTNRETEEKMTGFSRRAQGKPGEQEIQDIPFHLEGRFALAEREAKFSGLNFSMPGASIQLDGTFGLAGQTLDFAGTARLQAKVSQTVKGIKSLLLKVIDPLFARDGAGTVLPIEIRGTREKPAFKLDYGKLFKR